MDLWFGPEERWILAQKKAIINLLEIMDTNTEHTKAKAYIGSEATQLLKYWRKSIQITWTYDSVLKKDEFWLKRKP